MSGITVCSKSELDLFSQSPLQTSILGTTEVALKPVNSLGDDPSVIEFISLGHGDTYRDLSSVYLRLRVRLMKKRPNTEHDSTNTDSTKKSKSCVVNNLIHSLFRQVSVYLNGVPVSQSNNDYGYRAYFENLLNYGQDAVSTHLESVGWAIDEGEMDTVDASKNKGFKMREDRMLNSKTVELYSRIHVDMFNQHRLLLNGVDLRIVMSLEKPEFFVMEKDEGSSFIKIDEATLYINHVQINPDILLSNERILNNKNAMATYNYRRVEVKSYTVSADQRSLSLDNVVIGQLPNLILFSMVDNLAYCGKRSKNPFNFDHNKISHYQLLINGVQVPTEPYVFDYTAADNPISTRGYVSLFKDTGVHYFDRGHQITKKAFDSGFFIIATDLTADRSTESSGCGNLLNQGTVRIEARFSEPLKETITCLVYCEYDTTLKIDQQRNVYTRF